MVVLDIKVLNGADRTEVNGLNNQFNPPGLFRNLPDRNESKKF
jgi:hypothetical protein